VSMSVGGPSPEGGALLSIKQEPAEVLEGAIATIKELEGSDPASLEGRIREITDPKVEGLVRDVFTSRDLQEIAYQNGYETAGEYVREELTQAVWDKSVSKLSTDKLWTAVFLRTGVEEEPSPSLEDPIGTEADPGLMRVLVDEWLTSIEDVGAAEEKGWVSLPEEKANWKAKVAEWRQTWTQLKGLIEDATPKALFSDDLATRKQQYLEFARRLHKAFPKALETDGYDLFEVKFPHLVEACKTAWAEEISQIIQGVEGSQEAFNPIKTGMQVARDVRRDIVTNRILQAALLDQGSSVDFLTDVHYQTAVKQWGHKAYHLGYLQEELGPPEVMVEVLEGPLRRVAPDVFNTYYTEEGVLEDFKTAFNALSDQGKDAVIEVFIDAYKEGVTNGRLPLLDSMEPLKESYRGLEKALEEEDYNAFIKQLKDVRNSFQEIGITMPVSSMSLTEVAVDKLQKAGDLSSVLKDRLRRSPNRVDPALMQNLRDGIKGIENEEVFEGLIDDLENSDRDENKKMYMQKVKAEIRVSLEGQSDRILTENGELLKRKVVDYQNNLTSFGAALWGRASNVLEKAGEAQETPTQRILEEMDSLAIRGVQEGLVETLQKNPEIYLQLSEEMKNAPEVLELMDENPGLQYGVSEETYQEWLANPVQAFTENIQARSCREIVFSAVQWEGMYLQRAHEDLKKDREIVLAAVSENGWAFKFAHEDFQKDREIGLLAVQDNGCALEFAHEDLKKDREIVLAAVSENGVALEFAHDDFKKDREIVLAAVQRNWKALDYAHEDFKNDRDFVLEAVPMPWVVANRIGEDLRKDKEFVRAVVQRYEELVLNGYEDSPEDRAYISILKERAGYGEWAMLTSRNMIALCMGIAVLGVIIARYVGDRGTKK
jgi:hypothetical protein